MGETLDAQHGNVMAAYAAMGFPEALSPAQTESLRDVAWATGRETVRADDQGRWNLERMVAPWTMVLIRQQ